MKRNVLLKKIMAWALSGAMIFSVPLPVAAAGEVNQVSEVLTESGDESSAGNMDTAEAVSDVEEAQTDTAEDISLEESGEVSVSEVVGEEQAAAVSDADVVSEENAATGEVAETGGTKYARVQDAFNHVSVGGTVKLIANSTITTVSGIIAVGTAQNATLDLNG